VRAIRGLLRTGAADVTIEVHVRGVHHAQGPSRGRHVREDATSVHNAAMASTPATPEQWLQAFESAVRARDFARGRTMFAEDAVAFGTWARAVAGLDNIVREQWQNVWPRIRDFHFEPGASVRTSGDSAWIAGGWVTEATGPDGRPFTRPGRGTFVLERRNGRWLAVHSHFSLLPSQSDSAHGRLSGASAAS
jgi:ketosteroid isomerase-like protein